MKRTFKISSKRVAMKYYFRIFLLNAPLLALIVSFGFVALLFYVFPSEQLTLPSIIPKVIFYGIYCSVLLSLIFCIFGFIIADIFIKAHTKHTYIEIDDIHLVISEHRQSVFSKKNWHSYKKMWILKLTEIEEIEYIKKHIVISGKARYFYEKSDWLSYKKNENGIEFDRWWLNENGGKIVDYIEVRDFYRYGDRIVKKILRSSDKIRKRISRRNHFHRKMLEVASTAKRQNGISDKYVEKNRKTLRK